MTTLLIPCFNEASRFNVSKWQLIIDSFRQCQWVFINDGSTDNTIQALEQLIGNNVKVLNLPKNLGKGEAIRAGIISVLTSNQPHEPDFIGYLDADGAFNVSDILKMLELAENILGPSNTYCALITSRVKLSGRRIIRSSRRHYLGRIIATFVCFGWETAPYDTQSGFKLFRVSPAFRKIVTKKFRTRWFFDIELLIALEKIAPSEIWEEPLSMWREMEKSKIDSRQYLRVLKEILIIRTLVKRHVSS